MNLQKTIKHFSNETKKKMTEAIRLYFICRQDIDEGKISGIVSNLINPIDYYFNIDKYRKLYKMYIAWSKSLGMKISNNSFLDYITYLVKNF